ncbi:MAG: nucleotidyl transferase AbiEii/AbiGii toxin family protein, partial [Treponema sp.]|nr:nucleotidyl transferase AbiEii/AbiGii toxin family protein [Treponema sp.]
MLRKESVEKPLWDILINLNKNNIFKNYNLVGGTALSLQIGHRMSDDIDLFTAKEFNKFKILEYFYKYYKGFEIGNESDIFLNIFVGNNKIDFLKYDYPL